MVVLRRLLLLFVCSTLMCESALARKRKIRNKNETQRYQKIINQGQISNLKDAFEVGYITNPMILSAYYKTKGAKAQAAAAWGPMLGNIDINGDWGYMNWSREKKKGENGKYPEKKNFLKQKQFAISVEAKNRFALGSGIDSIIEGRSKYLSAKAQFLNQENQVLAKIAVLFLDCYHNKTAVDVREKGLEFHRKFLRSIELKVKLGEKTTTDLAEAQAKLAKARANLANAMYKYEEAKAGFYRYIGVEPAEKISIKSLNYESLLPRTMEAFIEKAKIENPAISGTINDKQAARARFRIAAKAMGPSAEAYAKVGRTFQYDRNDEYKEGSFLAPGKEDRYTDNFALGVKFTVPVTSWGQKLNNSRASNYEYKSVSMEVIKIQKEVIEYAKKMWKQFGITTHTKKRP